MDRFDRPAAALGRQWSCVLRAVCVGLGVLFASAVATDSVAADCPQITGWSNQDATFFPVERATRIDRSNTPGRFYFTMNGEQEKTRLVTYFMLQAGPTSGLTKDRLFSNSVSVSLFSFSSADEATGMFNAEEKAFHLINPVQWGYSVLDTESGVLSYYSNTPGNQEINYFSVHQNTIISIQLRSASLTESVQETGVWELANRARRARDLVDVKCGTKPTNTAPSIFLYLGIWSSFQAQMASGRITIAAFDPDGNTDLDWNTFRLYVSGVDKTAHALKVKDELSKQGQFDYFEARYSNYAADAYQLRVDRSKLMTEHNFFNIAWNGTWPVRLKICDRKGACGQQDYDLYFGPFLDLRAFVDRRCLGISGDDGDLRFEATWGNNGYAAASNFYVGLSQSTQPWQTWVRDYWTLVLEPLAPSEVFYWFDWTYGILPVLVRGPAFLDTGAFVEGVSMRAPTYAIRKPDSSRYELGSGQYELVYGGVDLTPGLQDAYLIRKQTVTLCENR